ALAEGRAGRGGGGGEGQERPQGDPAQEVPAGPRIGQVEGEAGPEGDGEPPPTRVGRQPGPRPYGQSSRRTRSRSPLTKRVDSSVENFLAISSASLMTTWGGTWAPHRSSKIPARRMFRSTTAMRSRSQCSAKRVISSSIFGW